MHSVRRFAKQLSTGCRIFQLRCAALCLLFLASLTAHAHTSTAIQTAISTPISTPISTQTTISATVARATNAVPAVLRLPLPRSEFDISHQYYVGLLRLALQKAAKGRDIPKLITTRIIQQRHSISVLTDGDQLDVFWVGTDLAKEQALRAIRIPLERGLMGFRKFTLVRSVKDKFAEVRTLADLQKYKACLGRDWPDVKILQNSGLPVAVFEHYEDLFKQVNAGACDYFPRGLHEGKAELSLRAAHYPNLVRYQELMLHYPFAVYFFTSKENETLAKWIEDGLEQLISSGELDTYMQQHPLTRHVFPLQEYQANVWINLPNPLLNATTDFNNRRYWIVPADFD